MGGIVSKVGSYALDPFNSFGTRSNDTVYGPGSTVSNPNGPSHKSDPAEEARIEAEQAAAWQAQQAAQSAARPGYMQSMVPHGQHLGMQFSNSPPPPPPPSQWTYQAGKGPTWQTPQARIDRTATNDTDRNWTLTNAKPGAPYGGNRF